MLRVFVGAIARGAWNCIQKNAPKSKITELGNAVQIKNFSSLTLTQNNGLQSQSLISHPKINEIANNIQCRTLTKFSLRTGKRKSVKAVVARFYRLNWGIWIRTKVGKQKKLWTKRSGRKRMIRQHVFCNATQSKMLEKMAGPAWCKPKYFVDDPYEPYHTRDEYVYTRKTPVPFVPKE